MSAKFFPRQPRTCIMSSQLKCAWWSGETLKSQFSSPQGDLATLIKVQLLEKIIKYYSSVQLHTLGEEPATWWLQNIYIRTFPWTRAVVKIFLQQTKLYLDVDFLFRLILLDQGPPTLDYLNASKINILFHMHCIQLRNFLEIKETTGLPRWRSG